MFNRLKGNQGFTLIELMIVVAIIGILAAIAIPNFLQYQLRARQTEARTNGMGIKTSMVSYAGTAGCTPGIGANPAAPTASKQVWAAPPLALTAGLCNAGGAIFNGTFEDIGFRPSGNVFYQYGVISRAAPSAQPLRPGVAVAAGVNGECSVALILQNGGAANNAGFQVAALGDLDGNAVLSLMSADDATGVTDCLPGVY